MRLRGVTSFDDNLSTNTLDNRVIAAMRVMLAGVALLMIWLNPLEPDRFVALTYTLLLLYAGYSLAIYLIQLFSVGQSRFVSWMYGHGHWVDIAWYTVLSALSKGTNSIFIFGFLFAILVASGRCGWATGFRATLTSVILVTGVNFGIAPPPADVYQLTDAFWRADAYWHYLLLRPVCLLLLGSMIAY